MGEFWIRAVAAAAIAYFCGCFNGAVIVSKYILRDDVRTHGSGNAGLTNFYRTFGGPLTFGVILTDVLKAIVALVVGGWLLVGHLPAGLPGPQEAYSDYWAGLFCLLGHMFPCMFQFKGGKGILSGGTIVIMIDWRVALVAWGGFLILVLLTRYVSLGSSSTGVTVPISTWLVYHDGILLLLSIIIGGLILWKHRGNIQRLLAGTESKFYFHKKVKGGASHENCCVGQRRLGDGPGHAAGGERPYCDPVVLPGGGVPAAPADQGEPPSAWRDPAGEPVLHLGPVLRAGLRRGGHGHPLLRGAVHGGGHPGDAHPGDHSGLGLQGD